MVGCVIEHAGRVIGQGFHARFGGPHAEIAAIEDAARRGASLAGSTFYVTLEPCCHTGKTGPCTDALLRARPARVVVAMADPFPQVAGQGIAKLRAAGIRVDVGDGEGPARDLNAAYAKRLATGLPWVIAKWAQTVDGRIATRTGDSQWISSEASRRDAHRLRARVDAVLVGIGTVLRDDPALTARSVIVHRQARRVVIDPELRLPDDCQLVRSLATGQAPPLMLAVREQTLTRHAARAEKLQSLGVELIGLPDGSSQAHAIHRPPRNETVADRPTILTDSTASRSQPLDLHVLLHHLGQKLHATNVMVEGGSATLGHFLQQGLIDQVRIYQAPKLLGDAQALGALTGLTRNLIQDATLLTMKSVRKLGHDVRLDYEVMHDSAPDSQDQESKPPKHAGD